MSVWTELYDPKKQRLSTRQKGPYVSCDECGGWRGHEITCSQVTVESINELLQQARASEEYARAKATKYFSEMQRLAGKVAILKHENNKLRKRIR